MTDKASVEIPSPVAGKVLAIEGKPGDTIAVGSELMRLEVEGPGNVAAEKTAAKQKPAPAPKAAPPPPPKPAAAAPPPKPATAPPPKPATTPPPRAQPAAPAPAATTPAPTSSGL